MSDLPRDLPGREPDGALGVDGLDAVRRRIADDVDATQGAWQRLPVWRRAAPLALALAGAGAWAAWGFAHGAATPSALLALAASGFAMGAVALAPRTPGRAERVAAVALGVAALALAAECVLALRAAPLPGDDVMCAAAIVLGGLLPVACAAWHLRCARAPARWRHAFALCAGGVLASMGAVWAECPATDFGHVTRAHVLVPTAAALVLVVGVRALLVRLASPSLAGQLPD